MRTKGQNAAEKEKEFKTENMVWTRIYYGREVMERILDTIDVKRALHQRFFRSLRAPCGHGGGHHLPDVSLRVSDQGGSRR